MDETEAVKFSELLKATLVFESSRYERAMFVCIVEWMQIVSYLCQMHIFFDGVSLFERKVL